MIYALPTDPAPVADKAVEMEVSANVSHIEKPLWKLSSKSKDPDTKSSQLSTRQYSIYASTNFCIVGKLFMAIQGATAQQCKGCAAYVQCLGSQQATSLCRTNLQPGATDDISLEGGNSDSSEEFHGVDFSGEKTKTNKIVLAKQGLPVDSVAEAVKSVTRSAQWEQYVNNEIGIRVNHEANRHGRFGRNCYALYGMFRGCLMPSLCLGYANV